MSYEGYTQNICQQGHYFTADCYSAAECGCGAEIAWSNPVDETNCDSFGVVPHENIQELLIEEAVYEICNLGHRHLVSQARYRIPGPKELKRYWIQNDELQELPES